VHHQDAAIEMLLQGALDGAGDIARCEVVVSAEHRRVHTKHRQDGHGLAVAGVDAHDEEVAVFAVASVGQVVVVAAAVAGDAVLGVEVGVVGDADAGGDARGEGLAGHAHQGLDEAPIALGAPRAEAQRRQALVGDGVPHRRVAVRRGEDDLARVGRAERGGDVEGHGGLRGAEVGLENQRGLIAGGEGQGAHAGAALDPDAGGKPRGELLGAAIDDAFRPEEARATRVGAERRAHGQVDETF
jgi:hypothetical protein